MTEKGYHYSYQIDFKPSYSIVNIYLEDGQDIELYVYDGRIVLTKEILKSEIEE